VERGWYRLCLTAGWLLRSARYASARVVRENGEPRVRKRRAFHAPLLVWMGGPLVRLLDTGVRVLPQRAWEERERLVYRSVHGAAIRVDGDGTLVLPRLPGETLAAMLEDPALDDSVRRRAIALAVAALADLHARGFTHGDAMAENVLVDLEAGVARWFDFETVHDARRPIPWRRADDVRALLATCLLRTPPDRLAETLGLVLDVYGDDDVTGLLAASFGSEWRPLAFHLGQAALPYRRFQEIGKLLRERCLRALEGKGGLKED
jgi:serine/threonine protein kinase